LLQILQQEEPEILDFSLRQLTSRSSVFRKRRSSCPSSFTRLIFSVPLSTIGTTLMDCPMFISVCPALAVIRIDFSYISRSSAVSNTDEKIFRTAVVSLSMTRIINGAKLVQNPAKTEHL
jgi:hypothetical protein